MRWSLRRSVLSWVVAAIAIAGQGTRFCTAQGDDAQTMRAQAEQLFALANEARAAQGAGPLKWDSALAAAALAHCERMAREGEIAHRYGGEDDLTERAGKAGAHFSLIEENVALGPYVARIHQSWMNSPGHRANLLNPSIDRVGIAVVPANGVLYAVADYARGVSVMTPAQVEAAVAALIRPSGVTIRRDSTDARAACTMDQGFPRTADGSRPDFVMRWQNPDLSHLPPDLVSKLETGRYRQAEVGNCPAQNVEGSFTVYRIAVLLYAGAPTQP
jgi:hypothetical protein